MTVEAPVLSPGDFRAYAPKHLWRASIIVLTIMPVGMVVAHRSSPLFVCVAALLCLAALFVEGRGAVFSPVLFQRPLGIAVGLFGLWSAASLIWSPFPATTLFALGEFWLPVAGAFALGLVLPLRRRGWALALAVVCLVAACLLVQGDIWTGFQWRRAAGLRWNNFVLNRPVLTILVLSIPLVAWLACKEWVGKILAAGLALLAAACVMRSESGAAMLGLVFAGTITLCAAFAPRLSLWAIKIGVVLVFALAPWFGAIGGRVIPESVYSKLASSHSRDRIDIWTSFDAAIANEPWVGSGFGVSPRMGEAPVAQKVPAEHRPLLAVGHPHNAVIQIWAELGLVGAFLGLAIVLLVLRHLEAAPKAGLVPALAMMSAIMAVSLVGHGAWQGWWAAAVGAAVVWYRYARNGELA